MTENRGELTQVDSHNVTLTFDGRKALQVFRKDRFDMVSADISVPEMDRVDLTEKLLKKGKDARVVVITGYSDTVGVDLPFMPELRSS